MTDTRAIESRIANVSDISAIVGALHAIASANRAEARQHLEAIRRQESTVAGALADALRLAGPLPAQAQASGQSLAIIVGAGQGFCGAYADRLVAAAQTQEQAGSALILVGARTIGACDWRQAPVWSVDMAAHAREVPALASRLADSLFEALAREPDQVVRIIHANPDAPGLALIARQLLPYDFEGHVMVRDSVPLVTLEVGTLIASLVEEYVFTGLCEALMLGFCAEQAARADAMARAQSDVKRIGLELRGELRRARQEQMTTEIIELSVGRSERNGMRRGEVRR